MTRTEEESSNEEDSKLCMNYPVKAHTPPHPGCPERRTLRARIEKDVVVLVIKDLDFSKYLNCGLLHWRPEAAPGLAQERVMCAERMRYWLQTLFGLLEMFFALYDVEIYSPRTSLR